jgi:hypothetical protein
MNVKGLPQVCYASHQNKEEKVKAGEEGSPASKQKMLPFLKLRF